MSAYFITFRSVTFAQRGEAVLRRAGISCALQRTPRWMESQGCGYCLRVTKQNIQEAAALLRKQQVSFRKIYLRLDSEELEEVEL